MPFNGSGTFTPHSPEYPVVAGTTIRASDWNTIVGDIATGLSNTICRDGQSSPTANINWGGKKIIGLAAATVAGDALPFDQAYQAAQNGTWVSVLTTGTSAAFLAAPSPALTALANNQTFLVTFNSFPADNATINFSGLGALPLMKVGQLGAYVNVEANDWATGFRTYVTLIGVGAPVAAVVHGLDGKYGRFLNVQVFSASGTYTTTFGTKKIRVRLLGAGAAGGGTPATAAGQISCATGGASGGYSEGIITVNFTSQAITIGTGGVGSAGGNGGAGGTSSFGAFMSATGGNSGIAGTTVPTGTVSFILGQTGGAGSGGSLANPSGNPGGTAYFLSSVVNGGEGGASVHGGGGLGSNNSVGSGATARGAGGGGASAGASTAARAGGNGGDGLCIIEEYA